MRHGIAAQMYINNVYKHRVVEYLGDMFICLVRALLCIGFQELPACGEKVQMGAFKVTGGQHNIVLHCKSIATAARTSQLLLPLKI